MDFDLGHATAVLSRTPGVLRALLADLPEEWTRPNEGGETWSAFDVVCHLIQEEETNWMVRAHVILDPTGDRRFKPLDRSGHLEADRSKPLGDLLDRFADLRSRNLAALAGFDISAEQLLLTAEHPTFGTVTLSQLLSTWAVHDLDHTGQIVRVMAKQYREAVGPWTAFLPIVTR